MADLEWSVADGVGTIRLNRPDQSNAFTFAMVDEWASLLRRAQTEDAAEALAAFTERRPATYQGK